MPLEQFSGPPGVLRADRATLAWVQDLVRRVIIETAAATTSALGLVRKATAVTDAAASGVTVTAAEVTSSAGGSYGAGEQAMLNDEIKPLVNELRTDLAQVVTDLNAVKDQLNAKLAADRAAGQQEP